MGSALHLSQSCPTATPDPHIESVTFHTYLRILCVTCTQAVNDQHPMATAYAAWSSMQFAQQWNRQNCRTVPSAQPVSRCSDRAIMQLAYAVCDTGQSRSCHMHSLWHNHATFCRSFDETTVHADCGRLLNMHIGGSDCSVWSCRLYIFQQTNAPTKVCRYGM